MRRPPFTAAIAALFATACSDYTPILDGPESESYQGDLSACQNLAASQERFNQEALGGAAAGGLLGAAVANHEGSATTAEGLIGGALIAYVIFNLAIFKIMPVTLTLPGIAGFSAALDRMIPPVQGLIA